MKAPTTFKGCLGRVYETRGAGEKKRAASIYDQRAKRRRVDDVFRFGTILGNLRINLSFLTQVQVLLFTL